MTVSGEVFALMPRQQRAKFQKIEKTERQFSPKQNYIGIVYEYIEEGESDPAVVEEAFDFFWRTGFAGGGASLARNWQSRVLLDYSDIVFPFGYNWVLRRYRQRKASEILRE